MPSPLIAPHGQTVFAASLRQQRRLSPQTISSCRDPLRRFRMFLRHTAGVEPSAVRLAAVDAPVGLRFLDSLEQERGHPVRSRHMRLSALRSCFRWVALREPARLGVVTRGRAMPMQRQDTQLIGVLTRAEMPAVLATPAAAHWSGRRE
jgi:site-specific recombinase XerD